MNAAQLEMLLLYIDNAVLPLNAPSSAFGAPASNARVDQQADLKRRLRASCEEHGDIIEGTFTRIGD